MRQLCATAALLIASTFLLLGQEFRANVTGRVTDASGAAMPNVTVQITNVATNEITKSVSTAQGVYTLPLLNPGTYTLTVEAPGFKKYVQSGIVLDVGDARGIDVKMELGEASESVTVTAEALTLQTETADKGLVINDTEVLQLPLNGRNPFMLSQLSAGVNYNGSQVFVRPFDNGAIANWSINGGPQNMNEFLLDGAPNNAQAGGNNLAFVTPVDSVGEFKVQTTSYDAEYGKTAGGIVNVSTKSGANQYHGTAYEFMRRTPLDALTPAEIDNAAQFGTPNTTVDYLDEYGFSLGGPVRIPKIYNGHDKTFFFVNYERYFQDNPQVEEYSVPTLQELGMAPGELGVYDFSGLNNPATDGGTPVTIYNPFSQALNSQTPGAVANSAGTSVTRSPLLIPNPFYGGSCPTAQQEGVPPGTFSCNTTSPTIQGIPSNLINPIGLTLAKLFPAPNQNGVTAQNATRYGTDDYGMQASSNPFLGNGEDHFYNFVSRIDQNFGSKDRVYLRFGSNDRHQQSIGTPLAGVGTTGQNPLIRANKAIAADWTRTISPTLITDVRFSFSRYIEASDSTNDATVTPSLLGFSPAVISQIPDPAALGIYGITNYATVGKDVANTNWTNTKALAAKVINVRGKHTLKAGLDLRWIQENFVNVGNTFDLGFGTTWDQQTYNTSTTGSGDGLASTLLGLPTSVEADNLADPSYLSVYYAGYLQDDWKVSSHFSVTLGLRYDIFPGVTERDGELTDGFLSNQVNPANGVVQSAAANFAKATTSTGAALYTAAQIASFNQYFPSGLPTLMGGIKYVSGSSGRDGVTDWSGLQPRLGVAYQITPKLVFRGGVARYMVNPTNDWYQNSPPGYSQNTSFGTTALSTGAPTGAIPFGAPCSSASTAGCSNNLLTNPFAPLGSGGLPLPAGNSLGAETLLGNSVNYFNQNFKPGWVLEYSTGFQYQLPLQSRVEVNFVGNRGYGLESNNTFDVIPLSLRQQCDPLEGGNPNVCNTVVPNPFYNLPQFAGSTLGGTATTTVSQLSLPYPEFTGGTESGLNLGASWYNGMEITYSVRANHGLTLSVAYTFSRATEAGGFPSSSAGSNQNSDAGESYIDVQKQILEKSPAPYDIENVVKISSVYQLPFGKGRHFMANAGRLMDAIFGGWEHNMLMQYNSGRPWNLPGNIEFFPQKGTPYAANLNPNWGAPLNIIQGVRPCVGVESATGAITLESYSTANGNPYNCNLSNINFLSVPTSTYGPSSFAGLRTTDILTQGALVADMSLAKTIHIWERASFQFRAEAFNAFNHPWLSDVQFNSTVTSASFGTITKSSSENGSAYPSREIQLGFKLIF